jgi:hypothetical protein
LRTEEEKESLPEAGGWDLQELVAQRMGEVAEKTDEELEAMKKDFSDYPLQQAAANESRRRQNERNPEALNQYPENYWN